MLIDAGADMNARDLNDSDVFQTLRDRGHMQLLLELLFRQVLCCEMELEQEYV